MPAIPFEVGQSKTWSKTISESDIYLFGGITGDLSRNHVDEQFMKTTKIGTRIAQGALSLSISASVSTAFGDSSPVPCVSYGYDKVRFLKPVFIGDTLNVTYTMETIDHEGAKTFAKVEIKNQHGQLVTVATHILKFLD